MNAIEAASACSLLVIDEEEQACKSLGRVVERFGCRARSAPSGAAGLELIVREAPALILPNLLMPDMNGPQFLAALRKTHPDLPVVNVTGHPDSALMRQAAQHAPIMLLAKPVGPEPLETPVRSVLGERIAPPLVDGAICGGHP